MQFKDIIGQRSLINNLTEIIDSGRVSHAQLFLGPNGYGSLSLALAYAQYLNCQNRQHFDDPSQHDGLRADSCGECPHCKKYQQLMHTDLHLYFPNATTKRITKEPSCAEFQSEFREFLLGNSGYGTPDEWFTALGIEQKQGIINTRDANDIVRTMGLTAYEAPYKVYIVWMMEKMNVQAANKLLKALEEPTPNTVFLLVSESKDKLLSTIISRAQLVQVGKIDNESIAKAFATQVEQERLAAFAAAAEGDYLKAKQNLQRTELDEQFGQMFVEWMRQLFKLNMASLSAWIENFATLGREQQKQFLLYAMNALRACFLRTTAGVQLDYLLRFGDEKFNASFPNFITANNIALLDEAFNSTIFAIERNAYGKIAMMQLSFNVSKALKKR